MLDVMCSGAGSAQPEFASPVIQKMTDWNELLSQAAKDDDKMRKLKRDGYEENMDQPDKTAPTQQSLTSQQQKVR